MLIGLAGCDRPFIEQGEATLEIVEPDFSTIITHSPARIAIRASAELNLRSILANDRPLELDAGAGEWRVDYEFARGLSQVEFTITDGDDRVTRKTVWAFHSPLLMNQNAPGLPEPRIGHTATMLEDRTILVAGGTDRPLGLARSTAYLVDARIETLSTLDASLNVPRLGHTATLLPDGRVLFIGGADVDEFIRMDDLIEAVELFEPETGSFRTIPYVGDPIRRAYHTASLRTSGGEAVVDLYGGWGDIAYVPEPLLGTRQDVQSFAFRSDTLFALGAAPGQRLNVAIAGHTQTPLRESGLRHLVTGTHYGRQFSENVSMVFDFSGAEGLRVDTTGTAQVQRTRHASALLEPGIVATFGGHAANPDDVLNEIELYVHQIEKSFRFPPSTVPIPRYGHTATKLSGQRILLIGGATLGGGMTISEMFIGALM